MAQAQKFIVVVSGIYGEMFTCYNDDRSEMAFNNYEDANEAKEKIQNTHSREYFIMHRSEILYREPKA